MSLLSLQTVTKIFGGLTAVNEVSFDVEQGSIVGLIGPNGAGKTTVFNLITGNYVPDGGDIRFAGQSIKGMKPHTIVSLGIARTFQSIRLFPTLPLVENVLAGRHCRMHSGIIGSMFHTPAQRREERAALERAMNELEFVGLADSYAEEAGSLSYGNQRLLDTARHRVHRRAYGQVDHATRHGFGGGFEAGDTRPVVWRRICVEAHENPFLGRYVPKIRRTLGRDRPRVQSELCAVCSAYPQISLLVLRRQRGDLFRVFADWTIGGSAAQIADFSEEVDSGILVPSPLVRQIILIEDGLGGTHRFACTAVDALVGVDVQRAGTLVNAVDGALVHASLVLDIHARLSDYIWHGILLNKY